MKGSVLVYGGCGALGSSIVSAFSVAGWHVYSVDVRECADAQTSIVIDPSQETAQQYDAVEKKLEGKQLDVVYCAAGGWAGGNIAADDLFSALDKMIALNLKTAVISSRIAALHLNENGLLVLTGAHAALNGTGTMLAYGLSKSATHHLVTSLVGRFRKNGSTVLGLLPETIDTPSNRAGMPNADKSSWTPPDFMAKLLLEWSEKLESRPASGSLVSVLTREGKSSTQQN